MFLADASAEAQSTEILEPSEVPVFLPADLRAVLQIQNRDLNARLEGLFAFSQSRDARCSRVDSRDTQLLSDCRASLVKLNAEIAAYESARSAYEAATRASVDHYWASPGLVRGLNGRGYVATGSGLVGGTGWILNYNIPPGATREEADRQRADLKRQAAEHGKLYDASLDTARYNFAVAIAMSNTEAIDLIRRVSLDQLSQGQHSAAVQKGYEALRGRQFDELGCHSNGAMICLAALQNSDVMADRVVLYGPQLTAESLRIWNQMIADGRVKAVEVLINEDDPVPPLSLLGSLIVQPSSENLTIAAKHLFTDRQAMKEAVASFGPKIQVSTFGCSDVSLGNPIACHQMTAYRRNRGCQPTSRATAIVPGTKLPGGAGVSEPPPPC